MVSEITKGVKVTVETEFQPEYSSPSQYHYVFTYKICIENTSENTVKLLSRHWEIIDSTGKVREVNGDGVVGQQPVLLPGEYYEYVSGCNLKSGLGKMLGSYLFQRELDNTNFEVSIPEFNLIAPFKLN